jgi:hypothetical protein
VVNIREKLAAKRSVEKNGFRWRAGDVTRLEQFSVRDLTLKLSVAPDPTLAQT